MVDQRGPLFGGELAHYVAKCRGQFSRRAGNLKKCVKGAL
jgi:hypothetical protein